MATVPVQLDNRFALHSDSSQWPGSSCWRCRGKAIRIEGRRCHDASVSDPRATTLSHALQERRSSIAADLTQEQGVDMPRLVVEQGKGRASTSWHLLAPPIGARSTLDDRRDAALVQEGYSQGERTFREPIGAYDPTSPPKKPEPSARGFSVAAARERCRELAREHAAHSEDGGLRGARTLAREAKLAPPRNAGSRRRKPPRKPRSAPGTRSRRCSMTTSRCRPARAASPCAKRIRSSSVTSLLRGPRSPRPPLQT